MMQNAIMQETFFARTQESTSFWKGILMRVYYFKKYEVM